MSNITIYRFDNREQLDTTLAHRLTEYLQAQIDKRQHASIALSGGSTPKGLFKALSHTALPWEHIDITLVDERIVDTEHIDSNERLLRENLLCHHAVKSRFYSLRHTVSQEGEYIATNDKLLEELKWPLDIAVLGMGNDGHTASWFADAPELTQALNPVRNEKLAITTPQQAPHQRITFTLPAVLSCNFIALHICGDEKWQLLQKALAGEVNFPINAILQQDQTPVEIYWAP